MSKPKAKEELKPRGRPKKDDALTAAERARRYREKQKADGYIKRYVTKNTDQPEEQDLQYWISNFNRVSDVLRDKTAECVNFRIEVARLHKENDSLLARAVEAERFHTNSLKELVVTRQKLKDLERKPVEAQSKSGRTKRQGPEGPDLT